jgi:hypothetical protein
MILISDTPLERLTPFVRADGLCVVYASVKEDDYCVCVGDKQLRFYTDDTLPNEIKTSIAMIRAFPKSTLDQQFEYGYALDPALNDIGWRVKNDVYALVLERKVLEGMKLE